MKVGLDKRKDSGCEASQQSLANLMGISGASINPQSCPTLVEVFRSHAPHGSGFPWAAHRKLWSQVTGVSAVQADTECWRLCDDQSQDEKSRKSPRWGQGTVVAQ